jgi:hypothetical protein
MPLFPLHGRPITNSWQEGSDPSAFRTKTGAIYRLNESGDDYL